MAADGHDQFTMRKVHSINAWVATCKTCGWESEPARHPFDIDAVPHTEEANPHFYDGIRRSKIHES